MENKELGLVLKFDTKEKEVRSGFVRENRM